MMSYRENLQKCHEYVRALEEERRKIQMFQRELPLCLEIVTQTIESCKQQLPGTTAAAVTATTTTTTECSEQTTSDGLVFEEFIPIKNSPARDARDEGEEEDNNELESHKNTSIDVSKKSDWLRSAQLWNQSPDPPTKEEEEARKVSVVEVKSTPTQNTMEIVPVATPTGTTVEAAAEAPALAPAASSCSTAERSGSKKEESLTRKSRRCWSPELHRRFLNALEELGGPHVATPKQIRELMKVDGLTNDEVKSHLQKYRLHSTRRPTGQHNNTQGQGPQFVVVGGMWVPPSNNSSGEGAATGGVVYAPVAQQPRHQASTICNSPATSSSARAATASPAC
ncbi:hypothetical protein V2J09_006133 [Rumex salicifolius]